VYSQGSEVGGTTGLRWSRTYHRIILIWYVPR